MRVFLTGLTGSLATALALLHHERGDQVWGCARNEARAVEWLEQNARLGTLFLGDAGNLADQATDMGRLLPSMDRLYHTAAMKHVDLCEQHPGEAFRENALLTEQVSAACAVCEVSLILASTDKACMPSGVYGATKLLAERIALAHGHAVGRLGNLIGSSGSVFAAWKQSLRRRERLKITDPDMTRYFMSVQAAALFLADRCTPGVVSIPDPLRAVRMGDVAARMDGEGWEVIGRRPGETVHQWLVVPGEQAEYDGGRFVLGQGAEMADGLSSRWAIRWDVGELLRIAGV